MLTIKSPAFEDMEEIPAEYSCDGLNISPELAISGVPEKTESLALILEDPDAPEGGFTHWVVFNIPPDTKRFEEGSIPMEAIEGVNDSGESGYLGPCPPSGTHHYIFELFALDFTPEVSDLSTATDLREEIEGHILGQATLTGLFSYSSKSDDDDTDDLDTLLFF
jgi:Raf kinase inhibitor-like YbhB/YbcL family protein